MQTMFIKLSNQLCLLKKKTIQNTMRTIDKSKSVMFYITNFFLKSIYFFKNFPTFLSVEIFKTDKNPNFYKT